METKHVLTNKDISEQYRDIKLHLMVSDFTGAFANWATRQITKHEDYSLISPAIQAYYKFLSQRYFKTSSPIPMSRPRVNPTPANISHGMNWRPTASACGPTHPTKTP